ncbi:MAG: carboxypeptidase regulatory-like domain-containing protein [Fimbriimonadaceae bacterium]
MTTTQYVWHALAVMAVGIGVWGCGGTGGTQKTPGQVSGLIVDLDGNSVRGARVTVDGRETFSNSNGSFLLTNVRVGDHLIRAEIQQNGLQFRGQNMVSVFEGELSRGVTVTMIRTGQLASLRGVVRDRNSRPLQNARVFAIAGALGSTFTASNEFGEYELGGLAAGATYFVSATGNGFSSDDVGVILSPGESRRVDFTLTTAGSPALPRPTDLVAISWTSPLEASRSPNARAAVEAAKRLMDPSRALRRPSSRLSNNGGLIEIDLLWNPVNSRDLLGYGIYRGTSASAPLGGLDFLYDPLTYFYADVDPELREGVTYFYEVTALNTQAPGSGTETGPSNRAGVRPIGSTILRNISTSPLRFSWNPVQGATWYYVFLYDRYPGIEVSPIWPRPDDPDEGVTSQTSLTYPGNPPLRRGDRYFYFVVAVDADGFARSVSSVDEFVF